MNKLISVIVPAYNAGKYLERCLKSISAQTHSELDIIVINDGSTDDSVVISKQLAAEDSRIVVVHQQNQGVSAARNRGIDLAKGDYIGFVDADDEIYPEMYATLLDDIERYGADVSHCGFEMVTPKQTKLFNGTGQVVVQPSVEALDALLKGFLFEPSSCTKLYRREVLATVRYNIKIKFNEDLLFNAETFKRARRIVFHDLPLYRYILNTSSASRSTSGDEIQKSVLSATVAVKSALRDMGIDKSLNRFYVSKLLAVYQSVYYNKREDNVVLADVRTLLIKSSQKSLTFRVLFLKYTMLYFPAGYRMSRWVYDRTFGRNKKWDVR